MLYLLDRMSFTGNVNSNQSTETDLDLTPPRKIAKVSNNHRQQKFRDNWLQNNDFKPWLCKVPEDLFRAKCRTCNRTINAELTVIKNHMFSKTHIRKSFVAQPTISMFVKKTDEISTKTKATQSLEIKLCGFLAEHNISFTTLKHLTTLLQTSVTDSEIIKNMQLNPTKGTAIIENVIAAAEKEHLQQKLQTSLFSVLMDESTDVGGIQTMCVIVRFFDAEEGRVINKFWDLCQVFEQNSGVESATAEHLFELVTKSFEGYEIPLENIIGFASDGGKTMMGRENSVASRFIKKCPFIYIFKCIRHSLHLCASNACKKLPRSCEDLARNIYGEFKNSSKRQHLFKKFQTFLEIDVHEILRPAQKHWLSLKAVISRIIEQWSALELYFQNQMLTIRSDSIEQIVQALRNPIIKLFYLFLDYILPKFTKLNELFQSSSVVVTILYDRMCRNYQELLELYMSRDYVYQTDLSELDPCNKSHHLRLENMYFGVEVKKMLDQVDIRNNEKLKFDFTTTCVDFLMEGCKGIKERFNFTDPILKLMTNLHPSKAMLPKTRVLIPSLLPLMEDLPRIVPSDQYQIIDDEWRQLPYFELPAHIDVKNEVDIFWAKLMDCEEGDQGKTFKNVSKFALNVISLPHSNADSERIFNQINLIKTDTHNKMAISTVNGLLLARQRVKGNEETNCTAYNPSQREYNRINKALLYKKKPTTENTARTIQDLYSDMDVDELNSISMPNDF